MSRNSKGATFERKMLDYLRDAGVNVVRVHDGGTRDEGDLRIVRGGTVVGGWYQRQCSIAAQLKNFRNLADGINAALRDLPEQVANARADAGIAIVRRHGKPNPGDALVVCTVDTAVELGWL